MIIYSDIEDSLNSIEDNLKASIKTAEKLREDFYKSMDQGNLKDKAFLFILSENVKIHKQALIEFLKLPLYQ